MYNENILVITFFIQRKNIISTESNIQLTNDTDCYTPCNFNFLFDIKKVFLHILITKYATCGGMPLLYTFAHVLSRMKQLEG